MRQKIPLSFGRELADYASLATHLESIANDPSVVGMR